MKKTSGRALVNIMAAAVILILAVIAVTVGPKAFGGTGNGLSAERKDHKGETLVGKALLRARDENCMSQMSQLRQAIEIATDPSEGTHPQTLEETKLGASFYQCPIGKERYDYDPITGQVHCPHPGHEKY